MVFNAVYWGCFDPLTLAHVAIINFSLKKYDKLFVIINNLSSKKYNYNINLRKKMIENIFNNKKNNIKILVQDEKNCYSYEKVKQINNNSNKLAVIAGEDSYYRWNFNQSDYDEICIVRRGDSKICSKNIKIIELDKKYRYISSGLARKYIVNKDMCNLPLVVPKKNLFYLII